MAERPSDGGLDPNFEAAQKHITNPASASPPSNATKLKLYGLFKVATTNTGPTGSRPWAPVPRAKWDAWNSYKNLSSSEASRQYVELVKELCPDFNPVPQVETEKEVEKDNTSNGGEPVTPMSEASGSPLTPFPTIPSMSHVSSTGSFCQPADDTEPITPSIAISPSAQTPITPTFSSPNIIATTSLPQHKETPKISKPPINAQPLGNPPQGGRKSLPWAVHPRNKVKLTSIELINGLRSCLKGHEEKTPNKRLLLEASLRKSWRSLPTQEDDTMLCLSVPIALDLLIQSLQLPSGSEVIMTPICHRDVVSVIEKHRLVPVPLQSNMPSSPSTFLEHTTPKTKVILISHLIGSNFNVGHIISTLETANIEPPIIVEDFSLSPNEPGVYGHPQTSAAFFSISPNLGGALCRIKDGATLNRMKELQRSYPEQKNGSLIIKMLLSSINKTIECPEVYGLLWRLSLLRKVGLGMVPSSQPGRCKPSVPLLLHCANKLPLKMDPSLRRHKSIIEYTRDSLLHLDDVHVLGSAHSHGSLLIWVPRPKQVVQFLINEGIDASERLESVGLARSYGRTFKNNHKIDEGLIYLSMSTDMSPKRINYVLTKLRSALSNTNTNRQRRTKWWIKWVKVGVIIVVVVLSYYMPLTNALFWWSLSIIWALTKTLVSPTAFLYYICGLLFSSYLLRWLSRFTLYNNNKMLSCFRVLSNDELASRIESLNNVVEPTSDPNNSPKVVLLTGVTGFVGQMVCRDLLIRAAKVGDIKKVYVLCRGRGTSTVQDRLKVVRDSEAIEGYRDIWDEIVTPAEGDMKEAGCGFSEETQELLKASGLTHILHCAASVNFNQPLADAALINVGGPLEMQSLATKWNAIMVHVSTAFVRPHSRDGPEELVDLCGYDAWELYQSSMGNQLLATEAMKRLGFPNTYTFTKCLAEHLLMRTTCRITRPAIVGPSWVSPKVCWTGPKPSTLAACFVLRYARISRTFGMTKNTTPVIPVDIVSQAILHTAFQGRDGEIINAVWGPEHGVTWYDVARFTYQYAHLHGTYSNLASSLYMTLQWWIACQPSIFPKVHYLLNRLPAQFIVRFRLLKPSQLNLLERYYDMPTVYLPFTGEHYTFQSRVKTPPAFDMVEYMAKTLESSEYFAINKPKPNSTLQTIAGAETSGNIISDLLWANSQPRGTIPIRLVGALTRNILRMCCSSVVCDLGSFAAALNDVNPNHVIVLAPTHRSYLDFVLVSYLCFCVPELKLEVPYVAAAMDAFARSPVLFRVMKLMRAIFLRRGLGRADPQLKQHLTQLKNKSKVYEVFIEGARSRDRRYMKGKTGFLRCLREVNGDYTIIPLAIDYDIIPEQSSFINELEGNRPQRSRARDLLSWSIRVIRNKINIGAIYIRAGAPIVVEAQTNLKDVVVAIQQTQAQCSTISGYHLALAESTFNIPPDQLKQALNSLGCDLGQPRGSAALPTNLTQQWTTHLHWLHWLSPYLEQGHWTEWMIGGQPKPDSSEISDITKDVLSLIQTKLNGIDQAVDNAIATLQSKGHEHPTASHIFQFLDRAAPPLFLIQASMLRFHKPALSSSFDKSTQKPHRLQPKQSSGGSHSNKEGFGMWGFEDSGFAVSNESSKSGLVVEFKGNRYRLCGRKLANFVPFIEAELGIQLHQDDQWLPMPCPEPTIETTSVQETLKEAFSTILKLDQISTETRDRTRHGTGQTHTDMYILRTAKPHRVPDVVVWPNNEEDVSNIVKLAYDNGYCLIPFGGGTNVTHALWCPPVEVDPRPMVSVDVRRLNRVLWVNEEDGLAHVEAGIIGRDLQQQLEEKGFTVGHEPDSIEWSTLGGWIATRASGMKKNKYGNIEDIVREVRMITTQGKLWQHHDTSVVPSKRVGYGRVSTGPELREYVLGSEGNLGIITSAVIRVRPLPTVTMYDAAIFPTFAAGSKFMRQVAMLADSWRPASVRLVDNLQFRLAASLKDSRSGMLDLLKKIYVLKWLRFDPLSMATATLVFEGNEEEVKVQHDAIARLVKKNGGKLVGAESGRAGYDLTFAIAYLRDFAMTHFVLSDSFETFVPWSCLDEAIRRAKSKIQDEHKRRALPGKPFISCRITQVYHEGACIYFYMAIYTKGVANACVVFHEMEENCRKEIMLAGGSLSHHHGIGKIRAPYLCSPEAQPSVVVSPAWKDWLSITKQAVDPRNVFGVRNNMLAGESSTH